MQPSSGRYPLRRWRRRRQGRHAGRSLRRRRRGHRGHRRRPMASPISRRDAADERHCQPLGSAVGETSRPARCDFPSKAVRRGANPWHLCCRRLRIRTRGLDRRGQLSGSRPDARPREQIAHHWLTWVTFGDKAPSGSSDIHAVEGGIAVAAEVWLAYGLVDVGIAAARLLYEASFDLSPEE